MKTVIEINGRKYDARTGELLANNVSGTPASQARQHQTTVPQKTGPALDGVSRRKMHITNTPQSTSKPTQNQNQASARQTMVRAKNAAPKSLDIKPASKAQRAKTLLRTAVRKPTKVAPQIHSTSTIAESKVERSATGRGLLLKRTPDSRLARAKHATKSLTISKFSPLSGSHKPRLSESLTVAAPPNDKKQSTAPEAAPAITKPVLGDPHRKQQVFNHTIAQANHHTAPKLKKKSLPRRIAQKISINPRVVGTVAAVFAVLILGSFLAYQNVPAIAMRVAANQAGFSGHIPNNPPAGFAFKGPIEFSKGNITLRYKSNSDDRAFAISQKPTDWTSESLLMNHILASKTRYQTFHDRGLTVFIFNDGNATWVDKGVWYSINGKGSLSSDQILSIAGSM